MSDIKPDKAIGTTRRSFLKYTATGAGVLTLTGAGTGISLYALRGNAPNIKSLNHLSAHEYRTLRAIASTHIPAGGIFDTGSELIDLARLFDNFLDGEPEENISQLKQALTLFEYGPVVYDYKWATYSNLSPAAQLVHWESWINSDTVMRRQISMILRKFISLVFFDQPEVWKEIAYPVPPFSGVEEI